MTKFVTIFRVLKRGQKLAHAGTWKTASALTAAIAFVLPDALMLACDFAGLCLDLTPGQINQTAAGLGQLGAGVFVLYTIFSTSDKVGL